MVRHERLVLGFLGIAILVLIGAVSLFLRGGGHALANTPVYVALVDQSVVLPDVDIAVEHAESPGDAEQLVEATRATGVILDTHSLESLATAQLNEWYAHGKVIVVLGAPWQTVAIQAAASSAFADIATDNVPSYIQDVSPVVLENSTEFFSFLYRTPPGSSGLLTGAGTRPTALLASTLRSA
jgi:hypothetical protein